MQNIVFGGDLPNHRECKHYGQRKATVSHLGEHQPPYLFPRSRVPFNGTTFKFTSRSIPCPIVNQKKGRQNAPYADVRGSLGGGTINIGYKNDEQADQQNSGWYDRPSREAQVPVEVPDKRVPLRLTNANWWPFHALPVEKTAAVGLKLIRKNAANVVEVRVIEHPAGILSSR